MTFYSDEREDEARLPLQLSTMPEVQLDFIHKIKTDQTVKKETQEKIEPKRESIDSQGNSNLRRKKINEP